LCQPYRVRQAVRNELRRALHPPYETPVAVFVNAALMTACWVLLPPSVTDFVFRFNGPSAFAMVLASWAYSDVPATNLLGGDAARSIPALSDPHTLRRMWFAKNLVLWLLVTPLCTLVAIGIGVHEHRPVTAAVTVLWIVTVPPGALGFAGWVGIWFPYHPLPLRYRWTRRRRWRPMLARWIVLALAPYVVVPALMLALSLPTLVLWRCVDRRPVDDVQFGWGLVLAATIAALAWLAGHRYGARLANDRREWLARLLADPDRG
jgi:hypothetical protein